MSKNRPLIESKLFGNKQRKDRHGINVRAIYISREILEHRVKREIQILTIIVCLYCPDVAAEQDKTEHHEPHFSAQSGKHSRFNEGRRKSSYLP